jgi:hypothetical protein
LATYSRGDTSDLKALAQLMDSEESVIKLCVKVISKDFELQNSSDLDE